MYHYTGASVSVPIYMHIRLCISMHLFLLGYEHFVYSWHKGRTGITRLVQVKIITSVKIKLDFMNLLRKTLRLYIKRLNGRSCSR